MAEVVVGGIWFFNRGSSGGKYNSYVRNNSKGRGNGR